MIEYLAAGGGLSVLDVNPGLVFWTSVTFLLVLLLLTKFAWKPIVKALDDRAQMIHNDIARAQQLKAEADSLFQQYQSKLTDLKNEALEIMTEARNNADLLKNEVLEKARKEGEEIRARSRKEIRLAVDAALDDIHRYAVDLSVEITKRVITNKLTPEDHKQALKEALESISRN